jgi:hypothetical protein
VGARIQKLGDTFLICFKGLVNILNCLLSLKLLKLMLILIKNLLIGRITTQDIKSLHLFLIKTFRVICRINFLSGQKFIFLIYRLFIFVHTLCGCRIKVKNLLRIKQLDPYWIQVWEALLILLAFITFNLDSKFQ